MAPREGAMRDVEPDCRLLYVKVRHDRIAKGRIPDFPEQCSV